MAIYFQIRFKNVKKTCISYLLGIYEVNVKVIELIANSLYTDPHIQMILYLSIKNDCFMLKTRLLSNSRRNHEWTRNEITTVCWFWYAMFFINCCD